MCGVAIREGKDVIELSFCNELFDDEISETTPKRFLKRSPGHLADGVQISEKSYHGGRSIIKHEVSDVFNCLDDC